MKSREIAAAKGVHHSTVCNILNGRFWKHMFPKGVLDKDEL